MGKTTRAPLLKDSFGEIHFAELDAQAVQAKFNCLIGSNERPRGVFYKAQGDIDNQTTQVNSLEGH